MQTVSLQISLGDFFHFQLCLQLYQLSTTPTAIFIECFTFVPGVTRMTPNLITQWVIPTLTLVSLTGNQRTSLDITTPLEDHCLNCAGLDVIIL